MMLLVKSLALPLRNFDSPIKKPPLIALSLYNTCPTPFILTLLLKPFTSLHKPLILLSILWKEAAAAADRLFSF